MIGQLIVFSLTGFKTALFSFLALALVAMIMRRWRRNFALALISALIAIIFVCAIADRAIGNVFFSSLITRRVLTTPGLLTGFYFDHFSKVPPVGVELPFFYDPTVMGPASEIGFIYCGGSDTVANAHLWAMGFARLGMPGIVGYTILAAFVIWIYDSLSAKRNLELAVLLVVVPAIALSSTLLTTVLISEGGLAAALLLYLSPAPQPDEAFQPEIEPVKDHLMSTAGTSV